MSSTPCSTDSDTGGHVATDYVRSYYCDYIPGLDTYTIFRLPQAPRIAVKAYEITDPNSWFSGQVIGDIFDILCDAASRRHILVAYSDPDWLGWLDNIGSTALTKLRGAAAEICDISVIPKAPDIVMLMVNVDNNHWAVIMVQVKMRQVYFYDSLYTRDTEYLHWICGKAVSYVNMEMVGRHWIAAKDVDV